MIIEAWEPIWGGGQAHVLELSKKLAENHRCEIDIYTMNLKGADGKSETHINERIHVLRRGKQRDFFSFSDRIFWIPEIITTIKKAHRKKKYDIIHAHANLPGIPGKILSKLLSIPVVYTIHGSGVASIQDMYGKNLRSTIISKLENFLHTEIQYDKEISVDRLILEKKNKNKDISIIPNGVNIEDFLGSSTKKSSKFKFIFVGRLHAQKGLTYLLRAISEVKTVLPNDIEFHIVGSGELENELRNESRYLGIQRFVKFRGKLTGDSLRNEYKSSDAFILPSLYEGQPLTLLEAWAAHLPVIVTDVGENPYIVEKNVDGFIVPPKDPSALASTLIRVRNMDREILEKIGRNGYNKVCEKYTWNIAAKSTYGIYTKLI